MREYELTTLPGLFVSSIPPPRYHRVNANSVSKDPLYGARRENQLRLAEKKKRRQQEAADAVATATLQPRLSPPDNLNTVPAQDFSLH